MCIIPSQYNNVHVIVYLFVHIQVASREGYLTKIGKLRKVRPSYGYQLLGLGNSEIW